jgi:SAM-dependent methyltransferase
MAHKISKIFRLGKSLLAGCFWYPRDFFCYRQLQKNAGYGEIFHFMPRVLDKDPSSHTFDKHYVYMDRWGFKNLLENRPTEHVDVGSSIRFLSMASSVTKVKFVDIRPVKLDFDNFECIEGSILQMPFADNSVMSLSCLHVAEHIGLGRYGDPLDASGTKKACRELARVLAPGGKLYFALPVGRPAVYFNAHRVHDPEAILNYFFDLKPLGFAAVSDEGRFSAQAKPCDYCQAQYACGCFEFTKIA